MRLTVAKFTEVSSSGEATPPKPAPCNTHPCPNSWWPYSNSKDFEANAFMILVILFCALICSLALKATICCFLRSRRPHPPPDATRAAAAQPKPTLSTSTVSAVEGLRMVVFSSGMKLAGAGAGAEAECTICLSEFVEGEGIRVLDSCNHGFHSQCIREWLSSHSSCPTCRATCHTASSSSSAETQRDPALLLSTL
ncbi:RING-H2 finger protein ATL79-like [Cornus florida]|uniref:RING-H2 finger protein ATL79-like n=1 Tax=Cornus florida TaxID=4283 RepID=UPI00289E1C58|nr:RING-H2 finger protein ATL79-like [Cornus florida]